MDPARVDNESARFFDALNTALDTNADVPIRDRGAVNELANALRELGYGISRSGRTLRVTHPGSLDRGPRWFRFVP